MKSNEEFLEEINAIVDNLETGYMNDARAEICRLDLVGATQEDARQMAVAAVIADLKILENIA